jgi:hypothetical protein
VFQDEVIKKIASLALENEDSDEDDAAAAGRGNKSQPAGSGAEDDSWEDSESEQPTVHSQKVCIRCLRLGEN